MRAGTVEQVETQVRKVRQAFGDHPRGVHSGDQVQDGEVRDLPVEPDGRFGEHGQQSSARSGRGGQRITERWLSGDPGHGAGDAAAQRWASADRVGDGVQTGLHRRRLRRSRDEIGQAQIPSAHHPGRQSGGDLARVARFQAVREANDGVERARPR